MDPGLASGAVGAVDTDGGVQAEAAGPLPGEHVVDGVRLKEAAALEETKDTALEDGRDGAGVIVGKMSRLVEADVAVEDHEVEVEVGVEGGAEAVKEGDSA
jgi:hypothetical protein